MTHAQDRLKYKIEHLESQIKTLEKQRPQVQKEVDSPNSDKLRKAQGRSFLNRINDAIEESKKDIRLMKLQL